MKKVIREFILSTLVLAVMTLIAAELLLWAMDHSPTVVAYGRRTWEPHQIGDLAKSLIQWAVR